MDASSALAPGAQLRRTRSTILLFAPDQVTCLALTPTEFELAFGDAPVDGDEREALLADLGRAGILAGSAPQPQPKIALTRSGLEFAGLDSTVRRVLSALGRMVELPWRAVVLGLGAVGMAGGLALYAQHGVSAASPLRAALLLLVLEWGLAAAHELAHGVVLVRHGGRIGRAGFGLHWGSLSFFVDATAALLLPRRARIWQASAGVLAEMTIVGVLVTFAVATGSGTLETLAGQAAVVATMSLLVNATPALGLDGAWVVADLLDRPTMVSGAGRAATRGEHLYRVANVGLGVAVLMVSTALWFTLWGGLLGPLWSEGIVGKLVVAWSLGPTLLALVVGLFWLIRGGRDW